MCCVCFFYKKTQRSIAPGAVFCLCMHSTNANQSNMWQRHNKKYTQIWNQIHNNEEKEKKTHKASLSDKKKQQPPKKMHTFSSS